jgi:hypothetical protein
LVVRNAFSFHHALRSFDAIVSRPQDRDSAYRDRVWLSAFFARAAASAGRNRRRAAGSCGASKHSAFAERAPAKPP